MSKLEKSRKELEPKRYQKKNQSTPENLKEASYLQVDRPDEIASELSTMEQATIAGGSLFQGIRSSAAALELQKTCGNRYVQSMAEGNKDGSLSEAIVDNIEDQRNSGTPLHPRLRAQVETAFEHDFSEVRIHTNSEADRLSKKLGAKAFTTGKDIFFREGAYSPETESGKRLIKHELAHTIQQVQSNSLGPLTISQPGERAEIEAKNTEQEMNPVVTRGSFASASIMRDGPTGTATAEPAEETEERRGPLQALWEATVVRRLESVGEMLSGEPESQSERINQAMGVLNEIITAVESLYPSYEDNPEVFGRLAWGAQTMAGIGEELRPHLGELQPIEGIQRQIAEIADNFRGFGSRL